MKFSVKILSVFAIIVLGMVSCSKDDSGSTPNYKTTFYATLSGSNEIPAITSTAIGEATLVYDSTIKKFNITVTHNVMNATVGHVHKGAVGANGDPVFAFTNVVSPIKYTSSMLSDSQISDLFANMYYVNIHSEAFPNGEIRGQLVKYTPPSSGGGGGY